MKNCFLRQLNADVSNPELPVLPLVNKVTYSVAPGSSNVEVPEFLAAVGGKKGLFRLTTTSNGTATLNVLRSGGAFITVLDSSVPVFFNCDLTAMTKCRITSVEGGDFTIEWIENTFVIGENASLNNYGQSCFINTNDGRQMYDSTAPNYLVSELMPYSYKVKFVSESVGRIIQVFKYDTDGVTFLGYVNYTITNDELDLSTFNAKYIRFNGDNIFSNHVMFVSVYE